MTDSPNTGNKKEFDRLLTHGNSFFHCGCWVDIEPDFLKKNPYSRHFQSGFDIIWECCTFQMYGNNRKEQMQYIAESLKPDGLVFLYEKLNTPLHEDFMRMEVLKTKFKERYFNKKDIIMKEKSILKTMHTECVTLDELINEAKNIFRYGALIWNAGNFYEIVVTDSKKSLLSFINLLPAIFVPNEYRLIKKQVQFLFANGKALKNYKYNV